MLRFKLKERVADKEFREKRRVTMLEIAADTGIGRITLSRMAGHDASARADTLDRLCAYFGCRIEDLVEYIPDDVHSRPETSRPASSSRLHKKRSAMGKGAGRRRAE